MSQALSNLLIHVIFSTKSCVNFIDGHIEPQLYAYISTLCKLHNSPLKKIGGMPDHIHMLISLSCTVSISKLMTDVKTHSSRWIKGKGDRYKDFSWQTGYDVFSIDQSAYHTCADYIANQQEHHKRINYEEELKLILQKNEIDHLIEISPLSPAT